MTTCQWNPKYDRPALGGEGDCEAEAAWEVGDKHVLRLCHDCAGSRSFARFSKRPTRDPVDRSLRVVLEKLVEAADVLDRLNARTEGLLLRIEIVERDMRHARAWVSQEIDTQRRLKQIEEKLDVKWPEGLIA